MDQLPADLILYILTPLFAADINAAVLFASTCREYRHLMCAHICSPDLSLAAVAKWAGITRIGAFRLTIAGDIVHSNSHIGEVALANVSPTFTNTLRTLNRVFLPQAIIGLSAHTAANDIVVSMGPHYTGYPATGRIRICGRMHRWNYPGMPIYTFHGTARD